ncbi:MAG: response regulator [Rhizobiales bacterium]|nr:response regulator [Hyphomicrobiales bacterium]
MQGQAKHVDILILDDDVDLLASVAELLADYGYRVKAFADPESAIEFAVARTFAVGLFDYRLGSIKNGLDVVETLQALGCKASYVMITAEVEQATQLRALHLKLFDYMRKPVQPEKLIETVERAMQQSKLAA